LVDDLFETLYSSPGVGLAAPQIGVLKRVAVIDLSRKKLKTGKFKPSHGPIILINPVIIEGLGVQVSREGCLSIPNLLANVTRFQKVKVKTLDLNGGEKIVGGIGFEALALQHEIDHLDGKLFLDRVGNIKTDVFRRKTY